MTSPRATQSATSTSPAPSSVRRRRRVNGGGGIRTPEGPKAPNGFQGRRIQPLCHPSGERRLVLRAADDDRYPPVAGPLLVAREARIEPGRQRPEPLALLAGRVPGPVAAAAALGPELDLGVRDDVVIPGGMVAVAAAGGDQDHVIVVGEVGEW